MVEQPPPSYGELVAAAQAAKKAGKLDDALVVALAALKADEKRFEAYALCALIAHQQGRTNRATQFMREALVRVPEGKKAQLLELAKVLEPQPKPTTESGSQLPATSLSLNDEARVTLRVLLLIAADADKASTTVERARLLNEFLERSAPFVAAHPDQVNVWAIRGAAAIELGQVRSGKEAGLALKKAGAALLDSKAVSILALIERKGWLDYKEPTEPSVLYVGQWGLTEPLVYEGRVTAEAGRVIHIVSRGLDGKLCVPVVPDPKLEESFTVTNRSVVFDGERLRFENVFMPSKTVARKLGKDAATVTISVELYVDPGAPDIMLCTSTSRVTSAKGYDKPGPRVEYKLSRVQR